ncbi:cation channel sperm-associated auxiliary subunit epsilon isoform X1 [Canis lupus dingo]|uniref:cation channel sperm-associated auxiliary subunit epsilon isoform X1 n=3 Tax=Canis lupus dingo TaxID=286419 RepID=UPI0020C37DE2|nr:cation channel sperm-associated auxiliary subunit epsilon isoform X1 [Canis lupus dingo]
MVSACLSSSLVYIFDSHQRRGCGWRRYSTNSPNYHIFSTRSTIKLEYEGTSFSEWSVPGTCSVKNKSSPKTELRCFSPGFQTIRPIVTGPDSEEERNLSVDSSHICFLWYYKVIETQKERQRHRQREEKQAPCKKPDVGLNPGNPGSGPVQRNLFHNLTQVIVLWIYDPENADTNELLWNANEPSLYSLILSRQLATLGQKPIIYTTLKRKVYFPHDKMKNGTWRISVPMTSEDVLKEIKGNQVAFQDCFIADFLFLQTFPLLTIPEIPGFLPISSPAGSQLMATWIACVPSYIVVVADMETFQTNDSFRTWIRIRVPPNILTEDERHSISDVNVSRDGIFFLINGVLYIKSFTEFKRLGISENLPNSGIIGITSRKWCWINYLLKAKRRSSMAIWTENEVYLGYTFLKFVKIITTKKLKNLLNISPAATLTIHNVEYPGHPLELALLLNYCTTCRVNKTIYVVIYNEDTEQWVYQDFALDVSIDSFLTPHFIYAAMPELILRDKHRIYYCYHNFTETGVIQTPTEFGNLSRLSNNSIVHDIFMDYYGNVVVKMENNIMFYFKINIRDAIKLHLWTNSTMKSLILLNSSGQIFLIYVFENGTLYPREYPLKLESLSVNFNINEKCPYVAFHNNIFSIFYFLDKGQNLSIWTQIVYPENMGLYIVVESYGPNILQEKDQTHYEIALGYCTKTMTVTFFQNINYEAVDDYFKLQHQNTGLVLVQVRPNEYARACPIAQKVFQIAVGCDSNKFITVKGFNKKDCLQHDFFYVIEKSYLRNQTSKNLRVKYNWKKYGCPLRLDFGEKFHPLLQLYDNNGYVEDVEVNFIVWEIHGRNDYSFNNTMKKSGCLNEAQTWKSMTELNKHLPLEEAWGPENYKHCFSYAIGKPGDLNQPYEIINKSNYNHLVWPEDHSGMYVFRVKILDPNYSFCNLTTVFAIETFGMIPRIIIFSPMEAFLDCITRLNPSYSKFSLCCISLLLSSYDKCKFILLFSSLINNYVSTKTQAF